jgi:CSLREA domain-containing protein
MRTQIKIFNPALHLLLSLAIVLLCLGPSVLPTHATPTDESYVVNDNGDIHDEEPDGVCDGEGTGVCTLREAIEEANEAAGNKEISFDTSMAGKTIALSLGSLVITGNDISIDGSDISGDILIDAANLPTSSNIFEIWGNGNNLNYLILQGWSDTRNPGDLYGNGVLIYDPASSGKASYNTLNALRIYGFEHNGILIVGDENNSGQYNTITSSLIGDASWASTSCSKGNRKSGIAITNRADHGSIGINRIVCNSENGIWLSDLYDTLIYYNNIGTNGTAAMGNGLSGIEDAESDGTLITNNTISGNTGKGVWLNGTTLAKLERNKIGVNGSGSAALPNGLAGVTISDDADSTYIGSATIVNARNTISGNSLCGIDINSGAHNTHINGNYIGLGGTNGTAILPNGQSGICLNGDNTTTISDSTATINQFIAGNTRQGIYAVNSTNLNINPATSIGLAGNGSTPAGNGLDGILLDSGTTNATLNPGKVMYNGAAGMTVVGNTSVGNYLIPLVVGSNVGLAIDLGKDGHTANGSHTPPGPNNWINYPEVNELGNGGVRGKAEPGSYVRFYRPTGDPTASNGGGTFLAYVIANAVTGDFTYVFPGGILAVSMQTCSLSTHDCSELSPLVISQGVYIPLMVR